MASLPDSCVAHESGMCGHRLKVVVVIHGYEIFGVRRFLLNHLNHAAQHGIDCEYVCLGPGAFYEELRKTGARVALCDVPMPFDRVNRGNPYIWLLRRGRFLAAIRRITHRLASLQPHVAYSHSEFMHILCGIAAKLAGCKAIGQFHVHIGRSRLLGLQRLLVSSVYACALDGIFAISKSVRDSMWGPARRKTSMIYNGVDVNEICTRVAGVKKQPGRVALVARICEAKKQELAIGAVKLLADRHTDCVLDIIGGPVDENNAYYQRLRRLVAELGLEDRVVFSGVLSPPHERVAACEACLSCASQEPFGLVIVEAMACGTPVVAANGGGAAELLVDGQTGLYFVPDDATSLATVLERVLTEPELRSRLAEAAYQDAKRRFDISIHMNAFRRELLRHCSMTKD